MPDSPMMEDRALPVAFQRPFSLNTFLATHKSLLLRSPRAEEWDERVDILFKGVTAIKLCSKFPTLEIREASSEERAEIAVDCGAVDFVGMGLRFFILGGGTASAYVVALSAFASSDKRHGSNASPLLFDVEGEPVPEEVLVRFV